VRGGVWGVGARGRGGVCEVCEASNLILPAHWVPRGRQTHFE
jgi:hypothetical protein